MFDNFILSRCKDVLQSVRVCLSGEKGNILVFIVMIMVIFAFLGAAMLSLFSTSIGSSATPNESRRAFYLAEAGLRYGLSELRQQGFSTSNITTLNTTEYKMPPSGNFDITVFGAWFKSPSNQSAASGVLSVEIDKGKIPPSFFEKTLTVPAFIANLYLVVASLDPRSSTQKPSSAEVAKVNGFSHTVGNYTSFTFDLNDDLVVGKDKQICMAIKPLDGTFTPGNSSSYLDLNSAAANIFPKADGSFQIGGRTYFYKTAKEEGGAFRIRGITPGSGVSSNPVTVAGSTDYILLSPNNYFVTSKGTSTSGLVTFGGDLDNSVSLADHSYQSEPDIQVKIGDVRQIENNVDFINGGADATGDYLRIGGISGPALGAMWFDQPVYLGGATDYCGSGINSGECFFENGVRVFFTLEYSGSGDGLIFALLNGFLNQLASVGGDFEAPELLGYAGDSRLNNSGSFLDTTGIRGLRPPKFGLEFDTKVNFSEPPIYCELDPVTNTYNLGQNTRNDPGSSGKDMVQYVFWGDSTLNIPCRGNNPSYDDNRHDVGDNPINYRDRMITSYSGSPDKVGGTSAATQVDVELESDDDWLKGKPTNNGQPYRPQWAVRMEVWRDICGPQPCTPPPLGTYILKTWLRQCNTADCSDVIGYFFEDTRVFYSPTTPTARPAQLEQTIGPIINFERFIFGFTSQTAAGDLQTATIRNFQLSFIRPGDPLITDDPDWP